MIGNRIYSFDKLESTSDYIKQNLVNLNDGDIIVAKEQTKGRGRRGNAWESQVGNLYFSFLISNDDITYNNNFAILMRVSVAIIKTLQLYDIDASIKYPNDIIVENKKIAGILIETIGNARPNHLVVGIGINVNQKDFQKLKNKATSLIMLKKESFDVKFLLDKFVNVFNLELINKSIYFEYLKNSYIIGKTIQHDKSVYNIKGISENGDLELSKGHESIYVSPSKISLEQLYEE